MFTGSFHKSQSLPREREDYRNSHSNRGADYDQILNMPLDSYMDRWEGQRLADLVSALFPKGITRYLDFACGTGRITHRLETIAGQSYGVDISESMLSIARQKCRKTTFVCADLTRNDVDLGQFDAITSFRFFGNAQDELRESALTAIHKLLQPGGYLFLNNHRNPQSFLLAARRLTAGLNESDLSHSKLKRLLRNHGFKLVRQYAIGFWIYRFKFTKTGFLDSKLADRLEQIFHSSCFVPFSLDAVLVARKVS